MNYIYEKHLGKNINYFMENVNSECINEGIFTEVVMTNDSLTNLTVVSKYRELFFEKYTEHMFSSDYELNKDVAIKKSMVRNVPVDILSKCKEYIERKSVSEFYALIGKFRLYNLNFLKVKKILELHEN